MTAADPVCKTSLIFPPSNTALCEQMTYKSCDIGGQFTVPAKSINYALKRSGLG